MTPKKSFMLYLDTLEVFYDLSPEEAKELIIAIIDFQKGKEITCSRVVSLIFKSFQGQFVRDNEKYEEMIKRNKANGSNGGRPPKEKPTETDTNPNNQVGFSETQTNPLKPDNDSVSVTDSDRVSDILLKKEAKQNNLIVRQKEFYEELRQFVDEYGKEMTRAFYDYWSEQTTTGFKMRKETQKTWETPKRLSQWKRNNIKKGQASFMPNQETPSKKVSVSTSGSID